MELNKEVRKIFEKFFIKHTLTPEAYYHLGLDKSTDDFTLAHSKRLRGVLCLTVADSVGVEKTRAMPVACAIECYHNASLIIDDIEDSSPYRCGREALWHKSGVSRAINTAFLLKTAAELALLRHAHADNFYITALKEIESASAAMAQGQTYDLQAQQHWHEGLSYYYETCRLKTGVLIGAACALGALDQLPLPQKKLVRDFGSILGVTHQIEDDIDELVDHRKGQTKAGVDEGSIIYFIAGQHGLLGRVKDLHHERSPEFLQDPGFWTYLTEQRKQVRSRLEKSLVALKAVSSILYSNLSEISSALCHRNDFALKELSKVI